MTTALAPEVKASARRVQSRSETSEVFRAEDDSILCGDVDEIQVDTSSGDLASQIREYAGPVLDIDHDDFALAGDRDMGDREQMPRGPSVRDEDVELSTLAWPNACGGCDIHAGIANRGGDPRQRSRGVLDVDDQVDRHIPRALPAYLTPAVPTGADAAA